MIFLLNGLICSVHTTDFDKLQGLQIIDHDSEASIQRRCLIKLESLFPNYFTLYSIYFYPFFTGDDLNIEGLGFDH